ncbi:MAG: V-type ATP synthase subunit C [Eubacteriales bacterium]|nr:V-type ATP synthase subunit C [Eubacteriales bacterium]
MDRIDYAQSVILARVYEKRLLGKQKLERMIDAPDENEVYKILMDSEYSKSAAGVFDVYGYVQLLNQEMSRIRDIADELLKDKRILEIMTLRYDYHNLKVILKSKFSGKDLSEKFIPSKNANPQTVQAQVEAEKFTTIKPEFATALKATIEEYERTKDPQVIDIIMDRYYFEHIRALAETLDIQFFRDYILGKIDFYNVISLVRMKRMNKTVHFAEKVFADGGRIQKSKLMSLLQADVDKMITSLKGEAIGAYVVKGLNEYRKTDSLFTLEKQSKRYLKELTKDARFITFGPEPIIAYILAKEEELEAVRFIIVGKLNNIPADKIRERLGD